MRVWIPIYINIYSKSENGRKEAAPILNESSRHMSACPVFYFAFYDLCGADVKLKLLLVSSFVVKDVRIWVKVAGLVQELLKTVIIEQGEGGPDPIPPAGWRSLFIGSSSTEKAVWLYETIGSAEGYRRSQTLQFFFSLLTISIISQQRLR